MAIQKIKIEEFLTLCKVHPVWDVRSPSEYRHAHIPHAQSLPLFSDEERRIVGTAYKQTSRETAIKLGLGFFGPKMVSMVEAVEKYFTDHSNSKPGLIQNGTGKQKTVLLYCWRGGMRSAGVAWLLDLYGFRVYTLAGGYKSYRRWALQQWEKPWNIHILGGYTGSGKTISLQRLKELNETVIDLEGLACHKGSAFGALGQPEQPSQEQFENLLAYQLWKSSETDEDLTAEDGSYEKPIWLEDESQRIGSVNIPNAFWERMRTQPVFFLEIPFEDRLHYLTKEYGRFAKCDLAAGIARIQKRLGGLETKEALYHLVENDMYGCFSILLKYYDKKYRKGLEKRPTSNIPVFKIECPTVDASLISEKILKHKLNLHAKSGTG